MSVHDTSLVPWCAQRFRPESVGPENNCNVRRWRERQKLQRRQRTSEPQGTSRNPKEPPVLFRLERPSLLLNFLEQRELRVRLLPLLEQRVELLLRTGGVAFLDQDFRELPACTGDDGAVAEDARGVGDLPVAGFGPVHIARIRANTADVKVDL